MLVPIAPGFEEIEVVTVIDVLRRADLQVTVAGTQGGPVEGSRGIRILPDKGLDEIRAEEFDMLVLPGGAKGVENLQRHPRLIPLLGEFFSKQKPVGAICAAPSLLASAGLLRGRQATSHPSVKEEVAAAAIYSEERVVTDGRLVTSRGPGTAMEFALKLVEILDGPEKVSELKAAMLAR